MKNLFKKIIVVLLALEARLILKKFKPKIVAITGSVGKTSAKEAIYAVLERKFSARRSEKSFNSELGVPLTVIGAPNAWYSPVKWALTLWRGALVPFGKNYPSLLILELGAERPGDVADLLKYVKPDVAVVTAIGEVPVHVEFFSGPEDVAREKSQLVQALQLNGIAVLNGDDDVVSDMRTKTSAQSILFGFGEDAAVRASEYKLVARGEGTVPGLEHPEGITFKVDFSGSSVPVRIEGAFGKQAVYAALAAIAAAVGLGMNLVEAAEALSAYVPPPGRLRLIRGEKETWILDDTYNASPAAMHAAIDVLGDFPARRKIAVLGDMLELGQYTIEAHRAVADHVKSRADIVMTVGPRSKFIADELRSHGFDAGRLQSFSNSEEAGRSVEKIIQPGDLILVKGSQAMRMERIVEEIMAEPAKKEQLLVRQEPEWIDKK